MCLCIDFLLKCRDFGGPASNFETSPYLLVGQGPGLFRETQASLKVAGCLDWWEEKWIFPKAKKGLQI